MSTPTVQLLDGESGREEGPFHILHLMRFKTRDPPLEGVKERTESGTHPDVNLRVSTVVLNVSVDIRYKLKKRGTT